MKTSLVGAVLSNTLLIVGVGFFLGGIDRNEQYFNPLATSSAFNELALSIAALIIPTAIRKFARTDTETIAEITAKVSRAEAVLLLLSYSCYILYSYKSHARLFREPHQKSQKRVPRIVVTEDAGAAEMNTAPAEMNEGNPLLESTETARSSTSFELLVLILIIDTVLLGFCTTFAVDSIDGLTQKTMLTQDFVGLILLPLLSCNLHAIKLARDDEMTQSFAISVSSSMQLLLCILPLAVIIAWIRRDPSMNFLLDLFHVNSLAVSVMILRYLTDHGKSNWYGSSASH